MGEGLPGDYKWKERLLFLVICPRLDNPTGLKLVYNGMMTQLPTERTIWLINEHFCLPPVLTLTMSGFKGPQVNEYTDCIFHNLTDWLALIHNCAIVEQKWCLFTESGETKGICLYMDCWNMPVPIFWEDGIVPTNIRANICDGWKNCQRRQALTLLSQNFIFQVTYSLSSIACTGYMILSIAMVPCSYHVVIKGHHELCHDPQHK